MTAIPGWRLDYQGKVRDVYIPESESSRSTSSKLLIVATDRVSAFDVILSPDIPDKGTILTRVSTWWMRQWPDIANHLLDEEPPAEVAGRAVVTEALSMLPVECVVRGYLAGSGWVEYQNSQSICGVSLPAGLHEGDELPQPIFTPATKAAVGDHDENIPFERVVELIGRERAEEIRQRSIEIYTRAHHIALDRGLVLADTKFEFGISPSRGILVWGDEALTPDSSRYWDLETYQTGGANRLSSFDKQPLREWLRANWNQHGTPPALPPEVVQATLERYRSLEKRLTGR